MRKVTGNLWTVQADHLGIPTNGDVNAKGYAVMGRGVALQATFRYPGIKGVLGGAMARAGKHVTFLYPKVFSFPVKNHWREEASLTLIAQSVKELTIIAQGLPTHTFAIPLVGTGNGRLKPGQVWPLLETLPDNVLVVEYDPDA